MMENRENNYKEYFDMEYPFLIEYFKELNEYLETIIINEELLIKINSIIENNLRKVFVFKDEKFYKQILNDNILYGQSNQQIDQYEKLKILKRIKEKSDLFIKPVNLDLSEELKKYEIKLMVHLNEKLISIISEFISKENIVFNDLQNLVEVEKRLVYNNRFYNLKLYSACLIDDNNIDINSEKSERWIANKLNPFIEHLLSIEEFEYYSILQVWFEILRVNSNIKKQGYLRNNVNVFEGIEDDVTHYILTKKFNRNINIEYLFYITSNYYEITYSGIYIQKIYCQLMQIVDKCRQNFTFSDLASEYSLSYIDNLSGVEFEELIASIFERMGYTVFSTKTSGDQGVDLVISMLNNKIGIQIKRYSGSVGNKAVQEIVAGMKHYNCSEGIVITNSYFTKSAIELAISNNIILWGREVFIKNNNFDSV